MTLRTSVVFAGAVCLGAGPPRAQTPATSTPPDGRSAPALIREGNKLLLGDKPADALELYEQAEEKQPDAAEIAFVQGLGHYKLGEYDRAKAAFQHAAAAEDSGLADDAVYSVGTCDHAAALDEGADPKEAMSRLESAMQSYHDVLSRNPQHQAARESNLKAATMWRQIKQQIEQQNQQQQQQNDESQEQQDPEQQPEQQEQERESKQENKEQQSQSQEGKEQEQQQSSSDQENQEQQQEQQSQAGEQEEKQQQETAAQERQQAQQEQVSRQQAERQLREMMQALKDRQKLRREQPAPVPVRRPEKDW